MPIKKIAFSCKTVSYYFDASFNDLKKLAPVKRTVIITDERIIGANRQKFAGWKIITIRSGEVYKVQETIDTIISQLIAMNADRTTILVGVGGGVITDITGYTASIFLRGVAFGFVPTSLLAMVDASIGGKNGVDVGVYKNLVGTISQPDFILYDVALLKTLPEREWCNGFAEIIKHAAIKDAPLLKGLEGASLKHLQKDKAALQRLVQRNALLKSGVVKEDEFEKGDRKLLNFGHTLGHALEKQYNLLHGESVAVGMCFAAKLSKELAGFQGSERLGELLKKYKLPTGIDYNKEKVFEVLVYDKKKEGATIDFILLEKFGKAVIKNLTLNKVYKLL